MIRHPIEEFVRTLARPPSGPNPPKAVNIVHYGPDGASVATRGKASYTPLHSGGVAVDYGATLAGGTPRSQSSVTLDQHGKAQGSSTHMLAADGSVLQTVRGDFGNLSMTTAGTLKSGSVNLSVEDAKGRQINSAKMSYAKESCADYALTSLTKKGTTKEHLDVSFAKAEMAGTRLIGGSLEIHRSAPSGKALSKANSMLTHRGVPHKVDSVNFETDGTTAKQMMTSDYGGVVFSPLRKVFGGKLLVETQTPATKKIAKTVFVFARGKLVSSEALRPGEVIANVVPTALVSIAGPWKGQRPPDKTSSETRSDGTLLEHREDWFVRPGKSGTPRRSILTVFAPDGKTVIQISDIDYAGVSFGPAGSPVSGTVVSTQFQAGVRSSVTHLTY